MKSLNLTNLVFIETRVKLRGYDDPILALVDHGSEIDIISRYVYENGKWPIDIIMVG